MTEQPIASYSFLPFARQGLGGQVQEADQAVLPGIRATIGLTLTISADKIGGGTTSEDVPRNVQMYGPGDVVGIDAASIVRSEPRNWITNFETNFLPFVEFYEEDFPWRYTPAKASDGGRRMRPWLTLLVLAEGEFTERAALPGGRLPVIEATDPAGTFPDLTTLWAWAHVHVNGAIGGDPANRDDNAVRLGATVTANRDQAYSRLLSPRLLRPNRGYHGFVVPSFESGRLAGLGKDPNGAAFPTQGSWAAGRTDPDADLYPIYHRWFFRTGEVGDFEYLVRLLQPRTVDARVGRRPIDVLDPGSNLPAIPGLGGVLQLGGALRAPLSTLSDDELAEYQQFEQWAEPYPHAFQSDLASLVNLAADYGDQSAADANTATGLPVVQDDEDPIIVPPLYGRWHAQVSRLTPADADPDHHRWVDELNHDPRHRVAAGLGTGVVQKKQEPFMEAAWQQVGKVLEGNTRIRFGHMAMLTSLVWHRRELGRLAVNAGERLLGLTAPVHKRVLNDGQTIAYATRQSTVPQALVGTTVRKVLRPRARVARLGSRAGGPFSADGLISRVNAGEVSAAPPKTVPENLPTGPAIADDLSSPGGGFTSPLPVPLVELLLRFSAWRIWFWIVAIALAVLFAFIPVVGIVLAALVIVAAALLFVWLLTALAAVGGTGAAEPAQVLDPETRTPESVDELPSSSGFEVTPTGTTGPGRPGLPTVPPPPRPGPDTPTGGRFKDALKNLYAVDTEEGHLPIVVRRPLSLDAVIASVYTAIDPVRTVPRRVLAGVDIPGRIAGELVEDFGEVMVYPEIDTPMYEPLEDMSSEYLVPNIQLVEFNSITLLETNQRFIEAYLVGLNHEFARELLWREYPTDQRGSCFRQFWDVKGFLAEPGADPVALRERLRDIPELHKWSRNSSLGDHDNREAQGDKEDELVLAIRGELLKKYPTAVIYAHRAAWELTSGGDIDRTKPRKLRDLSAGTPPRDLVKTPLYEAKVAPDIYFFGFDLTAEKAKGGLPAGDADDPGWFFVIKERPGEPRFGLDLPQDGPVGAINTWNELSWTDVVDDYENAEVLPVGQHPISVVDPGAGTPEKSQYEEDKAFRWRPDTNAAEVAYILYQVPVLMAAHAAEMLKKDT